MSKLLHVKSTPKTKGQIEFVTLGLFLPEGATTAQAYEESVIKSNPEVMGFVSKGRVELVTEEEYQKQNNARLADEKAALLNVTIEDALQEDSPSIDAMKTALSQVESALNKLRSLVEAGEGKTKKSSAESKPDKPEETSDGLDLPSAPPPGLRPQALTEQYLKKSAADRRKFLKECHDISTLRDIALFETDPKLKSAARRAAKSAESSAQEAASMAQAV